MAINLSFPKKRIPLLSFFILLLGGCASNIPQPVPCNFPVSELNYPATLHIIRRAEWGWKAIQDTLPQHSISKITIHHSGVVFPDGKDPLGYVRHLQDWSRAEKSWIDIPYHFMIAPNGDIYETRPINYPGDTNTDYDVRGHALICVIGNFEEQKVTQAQWISLVDLSAFLAKHFSVPVSEIKGHKDYTETLCPGKDLYQYIASGELQKQVQRVLDSGTVFYP